MKYIVFLACLLLTFSSTAQSVFDNGNGTNVWSDPDNWVSGSVPIASANIEIQQNVTYDETNDYTSTPKAYGDITVADGVTITLNSGSDLCFQQGIECTTAGSFTVTGSGTLVNYKPSQYYSIREMNLEGNFRIYNDNSIASGTEYFSLVNIKDGGVFVIDINAASTPLEIDNSVVIEAGGALYVENQNAAINIGRSGGSGTLTVQAGGTLGALTSQSVTVNFNNTSSALIFESGANFVENGSVWSFTTSNSTTPLPKPEFRFSIEGQGSNTAHWHQFSFPFSLSASTEFSGDMPYNTTGGQENLFKWNSAINGNEWTGWETYTSSLNNSDIYIVYAGGSNYPYAGNSYIGLSDDVNWAGRSYSATHANSLGLNYNPGTGGGSPSSNDQGWNPVVNPYPAHLKVSSIISELSANSLAYLAVHVWDPSSDQYIAYVDGGGSIISSTDGGTASAGTYDQLVPPGRYFWVKSNQSSVSIDVTESMRAGPSDFTTPINLLHGLKSQADYLKVNLSNGTSNINLTFIDRPGFEADSLGQSDAYALRSFNQEVPRFYEVIPNQESSELCINSLDYSQFGSRSLFVETHDQEILTISLDTSTISGLSHLYLHDKKLNITTDLLQNNYVFTHDENDLSNRFSLAINLSNISVTELNNSSVASYFSNDRLRVKVNHEGEYTIKLYNLSGSLVYETTNFLFNHEELNKVVNVPPGIYIIHVFDKKGNPIHNQKLLK